MPLPPSAPPSGQKHIGTRQEVTLPDGSMITLNTNTRVVVRYGPRFRDMFLVDGEASFYIAGLRVPSPGRLKDVADGASDPVQGLGRTVYLWAGALQPC